MNLFDSLNDLHKSQRQLQENKQLEKDNQQSREVKNINLSKIAIYIATTSFIMTAIFSFAGYYGNQKWQKEQIQELQKMNDFFNEYR